MKHRREKYRFYEFLVYAGSQQWDATHLLNHFTPPDIREVKTQLNKRFEGKFWSVCTWGAPWAHQPSSQAGLLPPSKAQEEPSPNHSILSLGGTRCSKSKGIPWGKGEKGMIKWDKHTSSNWFTDLPFTGFLVNNQIYSLQVQTWYKHTCTGKPKSTDYFLILSTFCPFRRSWNPGDSQTLSRNEFINWERTLPNPQLLNVWCFTAFLA